MNRNQDSKDQSARTHSNADLSSDDTYGLLQPVSQDLQNIVQEILVSCSPVYQESPCNNQMALAFRNLPFSSQHIGGNLQLYPLRKSESFQFQVRYEHLTHQPHAAD